MFISSSHCKWKVTLSAVHYEKQIIMQCTLIAYYTLWKFIRSSEYFMQKVCILCSAWGWGRTRGHYDCLFVKRKLHAVWSVSPTDLMEHLGKYNNLLCRGVHDSVVLGNGISCGFDQYERYLDRPKVTDVQWANFCTRKQEMGVLVRSALTGSSVLSQTKTAHCSKAKTLRTEVLSDVLSL